MSAEVWGVIAAFAGAWVALLAVGAAAFFWLLSAIQKSSQEVREEFRGELRELRSEIRAESQERRADTQRFFDALYRHRHDPGGTIMPGGEDD